MVLLATVGKTMTWYFVFGLVVGLASGVVIGWASVYARMFFDYLRYGAGR